VAAAAAAAGGVSIKLLTIGRPHRDNLTCTVAGRCALLAAPSAAFWPALPFLLFYKCPPLPKVHAGQAGEGSRIVSIIITKSA